jgi:hypothetical protein
LFKELNKICAEVVTARTLAHIAFTYKRIASIIASKLD